MDGGWNARFNCRDAVWWWMYCIKVYAESVNLDILNDPVKRLFPSDNQNEETAESLEQSLQDVVHEALVKHYKVEHIIEICIFFEVTLFEVSQQSLEATTTAPFDKNLNTFTGLKIS